MTIEEKLDEIICLLKELNSKLPVTYSYTHAISPNQGLCDHISAYFDGTYTYCPKCRRYIYESK